jgi:hypothetical protein
MNEEQRSQPDLSRREKENWAEPQPCAGDPVRELRPGTDYLYCSECGRHVACAPLEGDVWEVQCSKCVGECGLCSCRVSGRCLDKSGSRVQFHIHIARGFSTASVDRKEAEDV